MTCYGMIDFRVKETNSRQHEAAFELGIIARNNHIL